MSLEHPESVEEAVLKAGLSCKLCNSQVASVPDFGKPAKRFDQGKDCFTIAYPTKRHPDHLCYYHDKVHQELIS